MLGGMLESKGAGMILVKGLMAQRVLLVLIGIKDVGTILI